jgi:hypothetical protein
MAMTEASTWKAPSAISISGDDNVQTFGAPIQIDATTPLSEIWVPPGMDASRSPATEAQKGVREAKIGTK